MEIKQIKIFGERNTGTNYLTSLIQKNLEVSILPDSVPFWLMNLQRALPRDDEFLRDSYFAITEPRNLGWKHRLVDFNKISKSEFASNTLFITLTKNPYAWILSMFKRPHSSSLWKKNGGKPSSLSAFLDVEIGLVSRENMGSAFESGISIVELWGFKNHAYLEHGACKVLNLTYEALLENPEYWVQSIANLCGISFSKENFVNMESSAKGDNSSYQMYRNYYLQELWKENFSPDLIYKINKKLDAKTCKSLGYSMLA